MTAVLVAGAAVCDRSCYDAGGPDCTCVCGGANHGVGRTLAGHWPLWLEGSGCGRCAPWPCCGAVGRDHAPGCAEGAW